MYATKRRLQQNSYYKWWKNDELYAINDELYAVNAGFLAENDGIDGIYM